MIDLAIKGNNIITAEGMRAGVVLIQNGLIVDITPVVPEGVHEVIDIHNRILMPGVTDPHVHINEPGRTDWEGFETATRSAIAGGITTLVDMPLNASPVTTSVSALREKSGAAKNKLHTNCGFWGGIVPGNENEIEGLAETGILGFKAFLTHSGIDDFPNVTERDLRKAMPVIARLNLPLLVHCELTDNDKVSVTDHKQSYSNYLASRPQRWECDAIALMIRLCEEYNCRVHIVHLSASEALEQIHKARSKGLPLTVETAQHYLYFNAEDIGDGQTPFKCAPPIREKANNDLLWNALKQGVIDFVATDHSPAPPALKQLQSGDFIKAWGGIASLQFALPVLWTAARERNVSLSDIARWLCEKPVWLTGKQKSKGKIASGYDADLVVWDPEKKFTVTEQRIQHKHKVTPYLGEELYGVTEQTYLSGTKVFDSGTFTQLNKGKIITR